MAIHYILDGYNVIKQTSFLADKTLEEGRDGLIHLLEVKRPQGSVNNKVTVVFDGKADVYGRLVSSSARVIFSCGHSADEEIKRIVEEIPLRKNVVVVTNDRQIKYFVRALGANVMSVKEFLSTVKVNLTSGKKNGKQPRQHLVKEIPASLERKINSELEEIWLNKPKKRPGKHDL